MREDDAITLAAHLQGLANNVDPDIDVVPCPIRRGHWAIHVTDSHGGDWVAGRHDETPRTVADRIRQYLMLGA